MEQGPTQPQQPGGNNNRRRRRRRPAGKQPQQDGGQPTTNDMQNVSSHAPPQGMRQGPRQGPRQASQPGSHQGKRGPGAGGKRNNRGRRQPPAFVGPMDHSYRNGGPNGNVAEGNGGGGRFHSQRGSQPPQKFQPMDMTPVAVGREDAPARIFCFIDDLFFLAKIQETARKLNVKVEFVKTADPILEKIQEGTPENEKPTLVVFDLNNANIKPLTLIPKLRTKLKKGTSIIGFVSHLDGELKMKAQEAGCDMVMPRSAFSQNLPNLLRRHGAPEEPHDPGDQQRFIQ